MRRAILLVTAVVVASSCAVAWAVAEDAHPGSGARAGHASVGPAQMGYAHAGHASDSLAVSVAKARLATAKYVNGLSVARADGYRIITRMIPEMGFHFMNAKITGFDVTRPPILVYEKRGATWQLGAFEWVFPSKPKTPPLPGARYGSFAAACHYVDGTFVPAASQAACSKTAPGTGAAFGFWHPDLVTLHVWLWYPNPSGLFASMNPLVPTLQRRLTGPRQR
jgi:hypothetical protein